MRGIIKVIVRSQKEVEVEPGIFSYTYTMYKDVPANCPSDLSYSHSDASSINPERTLNNDFTFVFANDETDRINRIEYIEYKGTVYKVSRIIPYMPRVRVSVGDRESRTIGEILGDSYGR